MTTLSYITELLGYKNFNSVGSNFSETAGNRHSDLIELTVDKLIGLHNEVGACNKFKSEVTVDTDNSIVSGSSGLNKFSSERKNDLTGLIGGNI